jgi:hypothetical protein
MPNTAPNDNTFDLDPPRRPGAADFNGIAKENLGGMPVADPVLDPSAEEYNTLCHEAIAFGKVVALAAVLINGGATPSVQSVLAPGSNVSPGSFTITRVVAGHLRVKWPTSGAGALPAIVAAESSVYEDLDATVRTFPWAAAGAGFQGVEIKTAVSGVLTDADVLLKVY